VTTLQVTEELAEQIQQYAHQAGQTQDAFLRDAIRSHREDLEDIALATERLSHPEETIPWHQVKKDLGLND